MIANLFEKNTFFCCTKITFCTYLFLIISFLLLILITNSEDKIAVILESAKYWYEFKHFSKHFSTTGKH